MFISRKENFNIIEEMDKSQVLIKIAKDEKSFTVLKHKKFPESEGEEYHISQLKHILLVGS